MKNSSCFSIAGFALACAAGVAQAEITSSDPYALGGDRQYHQTGDPTRFQVPNAFSDAFFDVFIDWDFDGIRHDPPPPGTISPGSSPANAAVRVGLNGLPPGQPYFGRMFSSFFDSFTATSDDGRTRYFDTEMLSLDLTINTAFGPMMIRESPTLQSTGKYSIRESPTLPGLTDGGDYRIQSFFDIFTELSIDGGQTWMPSSNGPSHIENGPSVPAPGAAGLLALSGAFAARRRRH